MLNKKFFEKLKEDFKSYNDGRKIIISKSNEILKLSKQAIFAMHRNELENAGNLIDEAKNLNAYLKEKVIVKDKRLGYEGAYNAGMEELAEAIFLYIYLTKNKVEPDIKIKMDPQAYIGGLADFTGELVRYATNLAIKGKYDQVKEIKVIVESVIEQLIQMDIVGPLRSKYDQTRQNLRKLEQMLYDIKIRKED